MTQAGVERRRHVRIEVAIPIEWCRLEPGADREAERQAAEGNTVSAGGISFYAAAPVEPGTFIEVDLRPSFAAGLDGLQAVVTSCEPVGAGDGARHLVGAKFASPPEAELHELLFSAYQEAGRFTCACLDVRHCGEVRNTCPAFLSGRNCWQIAAPPCCHWQEGRAGDGRYCVRCPVTLLAFLQ
jgi:hypothetical protein